MNREIKFRVWDKLEERFIYPDKGYQGHYVLTLGGEFYNLQNGSGGNEYIVQQYTGLKDKNNSPIFEGDIIHYYEHNEVDNIITDVNLICKYTLDNAWFSFVEKMDDEYDGYYWMELKNKCEVIGNVIENKDLI